MNLRILQTTILTIACLSLACEATKHDDKVGLLQKIKATEGNINEKSYDEARHLRKRSERKEDEIPQNQEGLFPCLPYRYITWEVIEGAVPAFIQVVRDFGYTPTMWNIPTTNNTSIEGFSYKTIGMYGLVYLEYIKKMGFDEETWDCWLNHYNDYSWEEIRWYGLESTMNTLGWYQYNWESETNAIDSLSWVELTEEQKKAADNICYVEGSWNELHVKDYPIDPCAYLNPV